MDITPKYTTAFSEIKAQTKLFLALAVFTIPVVSILNIDAKLSGGMVMLDQQTSLLSSSNFTFVSLMVLSLYLAYLTLMLTISFIGTLFTPESYSHDPIARKHVDMPVIPNQAGLFAFMSEVDSLNARGQVRMPDGHLNSMNVDKYGNLLDEE